MSRPTFNYAAKVRTANNRAVASRLALGDYMGAPSYAAVINLGDVRGVKGRGKNIRDMFMRIGGIGSYNVELVIPQAFLMARTTDPDAQATIVTIEGIQRAAGRLGRPVDVNGLLTPETVQVLRIVSGDTWMSKTWVQIYGDFGEMFARGKKIPAPGGQAVGDYIEVGDAFTAVPLATLGVGAVLLFLAFK